MEPNKCLCLSLRLHRLRFNGAARTLTLQRGTGNPGSTTFIRGVEVNNMSKKELYLHNGEHSAPRQGAW